MAQIYVNGVRDNLIVMNDKFRVNDADWFLGGMPGQTGVRAFVDEFRVYNVGLEEGKVQALAHGGLGSYSARNIKFLKGGEPVPCPQASKCGDRWHVCTWDEQKGGALAAARANGMFQGEVDKIKVWTELHGARSDEKGWSFAVEIRTYECGLRAGVALWCAKRGYSGLCIKYIQYTHVIFPRYGYTFVYLCEKIKFGVEQMVF